MIPEDWMGKWLEETSEQRKLIATLQEGGEKTLQAWAEEITQAAQAAREAAPSQLRQKLTALCAICEELAKSRLMPAITSSPHMLAGPWTSNYQSDVRLRLHGRTGDEPMLEVMADANMPSADSLDPTEWQTWVAGLCALLTKRAEAHAFTVELLKPDTKIYEGTPDQILLNCYNTATAIAAAACRWNLAKEATGE